MGAGRDKVSLVRAACQARSVVARMYRVYVHYTFVLVGPYVNLTGAVLRVKMGLEVDKCISILYSYRGRYIVIPNCQVTCRQQALRIKARGIKAAAAQAFVTFLRP